MSPYQRSKSLTPVNIADSQIGPPSLLLRHLLSGKCSLGELKLCHIEELEKLLAKVLRMHSANEIEPGPGEEGRPPWWPDNVLPFQEMRGFQEQVHHLLNSWHATLASVLNSCVEYYSQKGKQPEINTVLKRNASSSSLGSPGASSTERVFNTPKRFRLESPRDLNMSFSPMVLLEDVLKTKYPVIEKEDYMNFLQLQPSNANPPVPEPGKIVITRSRGYPYKIPFSSQYGQKLNANNKYTRSQALNDRKRDWTNTHPVTGSRNTSESSVVESNYEVTYKPKKGAEDCDRKFVFPQRQYRQRRNAVERLEQAFCRPLEVRIRRINIEPYLLKKKFCRRVSVCLNKRKTDQFYKESLNVSL